MLEILTVALDATVQFLAQQHELTLVTGVLIVVGLCVGGALEAILSRGVCCKEEQAEELKKSFRASPVLGEPQSLLTVMRIQCCRQEANEEARKANKD